jgi:hypothetical protein
MARHDSVKRGASEGLRDRRGARKSLATVALPHDRG